MKRANPVPILVVILVLVLSIGAHSHGHDHGHDHSHSPSHGGHSHAHRHDSTNPLIPLALRFSDMLKDALQPLHSMPLEKAALTASLLSSSVSLVSIILLPFSSLLTTLLLPFAAGALLSDLVHHLLPHMYASANSPSSLALLLSVALFTLLDALLRRITLHDTHAHSHSAASQSSAQSAATAGDAKMGTVQMATAPMTSPVSAYINLAADALHNFCDGLTLAAAFTASRSAGIATTIAVILHELPQELADFALLLRAGFSTTSALLANVVCACTAVLGTWAALRLSAVASDMTQTLVLPFAAGALLYMTFASVLPDVVSDLIAPVHVVCDGVIITRPVSAARFVVRSVVALLAAAAGVTVVAVVEAVHEH